MTDLTALLERVEAATGPDREIDTEIARAFGWTPPGINPALWEGKETPSWWATPGFGMPAYTSSLDAAIALVERVLPGWSWHAMNKDQEENDPYKLRDTPRAHRGAVCARTVCAKL